MVYHEAAARLSTDKAAEAMHMEQHGQAHNTLWSGYIAY
jgi:hypothetical protein